MEKGFPARAERSLFLLSAAALCFEATLVRLFALQQFYHFAFLIVSLAVLGTAAGGTALALLRRQPPAGLLAASFAVSIGLAYAVFNLLPFDSYAVAWDMRQVGILTLTFAASSLPFLFQGWFTAAALSASDSPGRAYAANLLGSAVGPPLALLLTVTARLEAAVLAAGAAGIAAAFLLSSSRAARAALAAGLAFVLLLIARPPTWLGARLSPNKPLAQALLAPGAEVTVVRDGVASRVEVVEGAGTHSFPGLSLNYDGALPDQAGLYLNGDGPWPVTALDPRLEAARRLAESMPAAIAYRLRPGARALLLRPGAGMDAALALASGAAAVDVPIDEPLVVDVLRGPYADWTHHVLQDERLKLLNTTTRGALSLRTTDYDVIEYALSAPFRPVASGAFSLGEAYDFTLEAAVGALGRLSDDGILVSTQWLTTPPAESVRAWATWIAAGRAAGFETIQDHLAAFRSLRTSTVLVSARAWSEPEKDQIRVWLARNGYDPIYLPDLLPEEVNRFNRLDPDPYPETFHSIVSDPRAFLRAYPFRVEPPTDDRPYFFHFFRWSQTPDVIAALGRSWQPFGGSGYLVLVVLLVLMTVLGGALALAPGLALRWRARLSPRSGLYFGFLAFGFMFVEVSLLQRFTLPLEQPALSLVVVLSVLLLASGIGSRVSERFPLRIVLLGLAALTVMLAAALPVLLARSLSWSWSERLVWAIALIAPLGWLMGMPFPAGLRLLTDGSEADIGRAWAVNGAVSGLAGVLAAMVSLDLGLSASMAIGGAAYLAARLALPAAP